MDKPKRLSPNKIDALHREIGGAVRRINRIHSLKAGKEIHPVQSWHAYTNTQPYLKLGIKDDALAPQLQALAVDSNLAIESDEKGWGVNWRSVDKESITKLNDKLDREVAKLSGNTRDLERRAKAEQLAAAFDARVDEFSGEEKKTFIESIIEQSHALRKPGKRVAESEGPLHKKAGELARLIDREMEAAGNDVSFIGYLYRASKAMENYSQSKPETRTQEGHKIVARQNFEALFSGGGGPGR
jgi:hypothetical protein